MAATARTFRGAKIRHSYQRGLKGFALQASASDVARLARDARVAFIEQDSVVAATGSAIEWGLDRIDQRSMPLDGVYAPDNRGAGVSIFVVDTGVMAGHEEFGGRVLRGFTAIDDGLGTGDCHGHGTHVAGIAAGATYGVASSASIVPVRVLDCNGSGTVSSVLAGLDWILQQPAGPRVVNMSFGGALSSAVDRQVEALIAGGVATVVAAGNENVDACRVSPARVPGAITVGATNQNDVRAGFSNYGTCVDLFAPGVSIVAASGTSTTGTWTGTGTSAAAPFVAGAAALLLEQFPKASPGEVASSLRAESTTDALTGIGEGSPNRLLFANVHALAAAEQADLQLLADPGFEYGTTFWSSSICAVVKPTGCAPDEEMVEVLNAGAHGGDAHASLGGRAKDYVLTSEAVTIPAGASSVELNVYLWIVTKNKQATGTDVLRVQILDGAGNLLETVGTFTNLDACKEWQARHFDVSRYAGQTVRVSFSGGRGQGAPTWFLLDDVTLIARR